MAAQLNYDYATVKGLPGGIYDLADVEVISRQNDETDGTMKFGIAVAQGSSAGTTVKVPVAGTTADKIEGVVVALPNTEQNMNGEVIVRKGTTLSVMKRGNIWGRLATGVSAVYGAKAYVVKSGDDAGCFTTASEGTLDIGATFGRDVETGLSVINLQ